MTNSTAKLESVAGADISRHLSTVFAHTRLHELIRAPYSANRACAAELIQMDARKIPYTHELDAIGAFDVLEHIDEYVCHLRRYKIGKMCAKVAKAGFQTALETSFVSLLLPAMFASRLMQKRAASDVDAAAELRLPGFINHSFEALMSIERVLVKIGLRFPIGGSLLLVAEKRGGRE